MAKIKSGIGSVSKQISKPKRTSQGLTNHSIKKSSMNKSKKRSFKKYRGQG